MIVVGARCAGSPLAALLARQGVRVAVVERATFPKDTLSTHVIEAPGINLLHRLGVLEPARALGAEPVSRLDFRQDAFATRVRFPARPGDAGAFMSIRRLKLDPLLAEAAAASGAELMMATTVTGLVHERGRVRGVRVRTEGGERTLEARLVIGADGRNSTVAKLARARKYHVVPSERIAYWGFFEDVQSSEPELVFHLWNERGVLAMPSDSGLHQVGVLPAARFLPAFRADREAAFLDHANACPPVAARLEGATRVGPLQGMLRWESFFRTSAGPGWGLVGDAGHFEDPTPGQGMTDAFRQAAALAPVIAGSLQHSDARLDAAVAGWARWRDRDAFEHHWLACDLGAAASRSRLLGEMMRRDFAPFMDIFLHRARPSQVATPSRLLAAAASVGFRGPERRSVGRELRELVVTDRRRQELRRHPVFVDPAEHDNAGETEVAEPVVA